MAGRQGHLRSSTRRSYSEHIELYLKPGLGHLKLTDLTDLDVEQLYVAMRELWQDLDESGELPSDLLKRLLSVRHDPTKARALSPARVRRVHPTLMSALNSGVKRKKMASNPAQHVELRDRGRRPEDRQRRPAGQPRLDHRRDPAPVATSSGE